MKVAVIFIACQRDPNQVWAKNIATAGCPFDVIYVSNGYNGKVDIEPVKMFLHGENKGIAKGVNPALRWAHSQGYDYVCTMADDILEPDFWLNNRISVAEQYAAGIVAISPENNHPAPIETEVIGNPLISWAVMDKIGFWNENYGMYGPIDLDYNARARATGFKVMYAAGIAHHLNTPADYGYSKPALVNQGWGQHVSDVGKYARGIGLYHQ